MRSSASPIGSQSATARWVGLIPVPDRTNRGSPSASRSRASALLTAGCVIVSALAARVTLPSVIKASNTFRRLRSSARNDTADIHHGDILDHDYKLGR